MSEKEEEKNCTKNSFLICVAFLYLFNFNKYGIRTNMDE